jgi:hypothetical protein
VPGFPSVLFLLNFLTKTTLLCGMYPAHLISLYLIILIIIEEEYNL